MTLREQINLLLQRIEILEKENAELRAEIKRLKKGNNSENSSMPPSHDLRRPKRNRSLRGKSGRKPGGQKGHKGNYLKMREEEDVDLVIEHPPDNCTECNLSLAEIEGEIGLCGQIIDIPKIAFKVTEHQQIVKNCPCCGIENKGKLPGTLDYCQVQYGLNIQYLIAYLSVYQFIAVDRIRDLFSVLTSESISTGFIYKSIRTISTSLEEAYHKILVHIKASKVAGSDETGCRISGSRMWFWIWTTTKFRYLIASVNRGYKTIEHVLGKEANSFILVTDCWAAQLKTNTLLKQLCLVHLQRDCQKLIDYYSSTWAKEMKKLLEQIIALSRENKEPDHMSQQLNEKLDNLLSRKLGSSHEKVINLRDRLLKHRTHLTTCLEYPEVPAHNNESEQGLRNLKVKEKITTGFRTMRGALDYGIIRSVVDSAKLQGINPFDAMRNPDIIFR